MGFISLFTSYSGRIGRLAFWLGLVVLMVLGGAATYEVLKLLTSGNVGKAWAVMSSEMTTVQMVTYLVLLLPLSALIVKRLHDRNKSGFWLALIWVPALIKIGHPFIIEYLGDGSIVKWGLTLATKFLTAEMAVVGFWFLIELGFFGAKDEGNRYNTAVQA